MTLSESEFYEAGLNLPPSVRKAVARRLLESVEVGDDSVGEAWADEIASRIDDIRSGKVKTIPGEEVFARIEKRRAAREAARNA